MKKATKDKISKFLFDSLTAEQRNQLKELMEQETLNFNPPLIKGQYDCVKVGIELIPGSYGKGMVLKEDIEKLK